MAQKYGVGTQTIYAEIKTKDKVIKYCTESDSVIVFGNRRNLQSAFELAEYELFRQERFKGTPISSLMIMEKAKFRHS